MPLMAVRFAVWILIILCPHRIDALFMQNGFTCETTFNMLYLDHVSIQEIASLMSSNCNFCCGIFDLLNFEAYNTCLYRVKCHKGTLIHQVKGVLWAFTVYLHFSKDHILLSLTLSPLWRLACRHIKGCDMSCLELWLFSPWRIFLCWVNLR